MREIKYRSFVKNKGMFYFTIDELLKSTVHSEGICYSGGDMQYVWREGIKMQFTGLTDKHGKEIYEGDIVECYDHPYNEDSGIFEIGFSHGAFSCKNSSLLLRDFGNWQHLRNP